MENLVAELWPFSRYPGLLGLLPPMRPGGAGRSIGFVARRAGAETVVLVFGFTQGLFQRLADGLMDDGATLWVATSTVFDGPATDAACTTARRVQRWFDKHLLGKPAPRTGPDPRIGNREELLRVCADAWHRKGRGNLTLPALAEALADAGVCGPGDPEKQLKRWMHPDHGECFVTADELKRSILGGARGARYDIGNLSLSRDIRRDEDAQAAHNRASPPQHSGQSGGPAVTGGNGMLATTNSIAAFRCGPPTALHASRGSGMLRPPVPPQCCPTAAEAIIPARCPRGAGPVLFDGGGRLGPGTP